MFGRGRFQLWLILFLICLVGREFRGLGFESISITLLAIIIAITDRRLHRNILSSRYNVFVIVFFAFYSSLSCIYALQYSGTDFVWKNFIEDLYALFLFLEFYFLGGTVSFERDEDRKPLCNTILAALLANLGMCVAYYSNAWADTFMQRLWNPYLLALLPLSYAVATSRWSLAIATSTAVSMLAYCTSFQMKAVAAFVLLVAFAPKRALGIAGGNLIAGIALTTFIVVQIGFLAVDPYELVKVDHNFGVRAVFWKEAVNEFFSQPYGFNFGVSVITGDMSAIGEADFHGGRHYEDLGVHSGIVSLLYKVGIFSVLIWWLVIRTLFSVSRRNSSALKYSLIIWFAALLSLFANDSIFTPHFCVGLAFVLGVLSPDETNING